MTPFRASGLRVTVSPRDCRLPLRSLLHVCQGPLLAVRRQIVDSRSAGPEPLCLGAVADSRSASTRHPSTSTGAAGKPNLAVDRLPDLHGVLADDRVGDVDCQQLEFDVVGEVVGRSQRPLLADDAEDRREAPLNAGRRRTDEDGIPADKSTELLPGMGGSQRRMRCIDLLD